jgi:hypothetical protein
MAEGRGEWSASLPSRPLPPAVIAPGASWTGGWVGLGGGGRCGEDKNLFPLPGMEHRFLGRISYSLVSIRRGADKSLAFPISYFPICCTAKIIFL